MEEYEIFPEYICLEPNNKLSYGHLNNNPTIHEWSELKKFIKRKLKCEK